jgi:uncharacterized protein YegL
MAYNTRFSKSEELLWAPLDAGGASSLREGFTSLEKALSTRHGFLGHPSGCIAPAFILFTEGSPTDHPHNGLQILKSNKWYQGGVKMAIGYNNGDAAWLLACTGHPDIQHCIHMIFMS